MGHDIPGQPSTRFPAAKGSHPFRTWCVMASAPARLDPYGIVNRCRGTSSARPPPQGSLLPVAIVRPSAMATKARSSWAYLPFRQSHALQPPIRCCAGRGGEGGCWRISSDPKFCPLIGPVGLPARRRHAPLSPAVARTLVWRHDLAARTCYNCSRCPSVYPLPSHPLGLGIGKK